MYERNTFVKSEIELNSLSDYFGEGIFFESTPCYVKINEKQTTKASISKALEGLQRNAKEPGVEIIRVNGWDYPALIKAYEKAEKLATLKDLGPLHRVRN